MTSLRKAIDVPVTKQIHLNSALGNTEVKKESSSRSNQRWINSTMDQLSQLGRALFRRVQRKRESMHADVRRRVVQGMRSRRRRLVTESLESRQLLAADLALVADIEQAGAPNYIGGLEIGGKFYFRDTSPIYGAELFSYDPIANTKTLVADINPGLADSQPSNFQGFVQAGTKLFFTATDATIGRELRWIDTALANPVVNSIDVNVGVADSDPGYETGFKLVGNKLYFGALSTSLGQELHWIDTTSPTPTVNSLDVYAGTTGSFAGSYGGFNAVGSKLYFTARTAAAGNELRWIDTTLSVPTLNTVDVNAGVASSDAGRYGFHLVGNNLYFSAIRTDGNELRWIDTTLTTPTVRTLDIFAGGSSSDPASSGGFAAIGNRLYFSAQDSSRGVELRWIDTTLTSPVLQTIDFYAGSPSSNPGFNGFLQVVGSKLYFSARDAATGYELRWLDSSLPSPVINTLDISAGTASSSPDKFTMVGDKLYFSALGATTSTELHWIDTTLATPIANVLDINPGNNPGFPGSYGGFSVGADRFYFTAQTANVYSLKWISNTQTTPTVNTVPIQSSSFGSEPGSSVGMALANGKLFFPATTNFIAGNELRMVDTSGPAGVFSTFDLSAGTAASGPGIYGGFKVIGSKVFFAASNTSGVELRWIDAQATNPVINTIDVYGGSGSSFPGQYGGFAAVGSRLYFSAYIPGTGVELRWVDTSLANPVVNTLEINPGSNNSMALQYTSFKQVGNKLYFTAENQDEGVELRWIDVTLATPVLNTVDVYAGAGYSKAGEFGGLITVGNKLFFTAKDADNGEELRWIDTTATIPTFGTLNIYSGSIGSMAGQVGGFTAVGNKLYFTARGDNNRLELRWIDAALETPILNTIPISENFELTPGQFKGFVAAGTRLYFTAFTSTHGDELRWIDTTLATPTIQTIDLNPGSAGSSAGQYGGFTLFDDNLYFTALDSQIGFELRWIDTTLATPTVSSLDVNTGISSSYAGRYSGFHPVGTKLYFSADKIGFGTELFAIDTAPPTLNATSDGGGNWTITDTDSLGKDNHLTISRDGTNYVITSTIEKFPNGTTSLSIPQAALTGSLTINAAGGNDTLVLNYAAGNPVPAGGLSFLGGASSNDQLLVSGGSLASTTYNATQPGSGNLNLDGAAIAFIGVESLNLAGSNLTNLTVNVDPQSQTAGQIVTTVAAHTLAAQSQISFTQGLTHLIAGSVTGSLLIQGETGSGDTINWQSAGTGIVSHISLNGQGGADIVNLNSDWTLPANKHLTVTAESFNLNANADWTTQGAGVITIQADNVDLNGTATLASGTSVTIRPVINQRPIDLGTNTVGSLSLTNAELARINSNTTIGSSTSGAISITNTLAVAGRGLRLVTGSGVSGAASIVNSHPTINGEITFDQLGESTYSGVIGGPAGGSNADKLLTIRKAGPGTLTLNSANTYLGWTMVDAGTLRVTHASALGATNSGTMVSSGASLQLQNSISVSGEFLSISGTGVEATGALWSMSGNNSWFGVIELNAAATIGNQDDELLLNNIDNKGFTVTFNIGDVSRLFGTLSGAGEVKKTGSGQLLFQANNTYAGETNILSGSINLVGPGTLGSAGAGTTIANGATLSILNTTPVLDNITASGIGFTGFGAINGDDGAQLVGNVLLVGNTRIAKFDAVSPFVISGNISDGGLGYGIEVQGSQTGRAITLAGTNTYTGPTQLTEPVTLNINGSLTSNVSLVSGALLGGNGTIYGSVTSTGTGTVNPGLGGAGRLTVVGNYSANTTFDIQDDYLTAGPGGDYDQLVVQGTSSQINLGTKTVTFQSAGGGTAPLLPDYLTLINNQTSNAVVPFSNLTAGSQVTLGLAAQARTFNSSYVGGNGRDLVLTGIPPNRAPSGSGGALNVLEDTVRILTAGDFKFSDPDSGDSLQSVTLTSVPSLGQLYLDLNGNSVYDDATETLSADSVVTVAQLTENRLRYLPPANAFGFSYAYFGFRVSDGQLLSNSSGFTIHVTSVNDAPTFVAGGNQTVLEDAGPQIVGATAGSPKLYWINNTSKQIQRSNLDGTNLEVVHDIANAGHSFQDIKVDAVGGKIYWSESSAMKRANLDGTNVETLLVSSPSVAIPTKFVLDAAGGKIYYFGRSPTNIYFRFIYSMNLNGSNQTLLFEANTLPAVTTAQVNSLTLDPVAGKLYWVNSNGQETIGRANLDGTNLQLLIGVNQAGYAYREVQLDLVNGKMYWTSNNTTHSIQRSNLDGGGIEVLVTGYEYLRDFELDVAANKMYWLNGDRTNPSSEGAVQSANLNGSQIQSLIPNINIGVSPSRPQMGLYLPNSVASGWATAISAGPANESSQTLSFQVVSNSNPQLFSVAPSINTSGVLSYTPAPNAFGTATIGVRLQDSGGTANGGINSSPLQTFTITVTPVDDDGSDVLLSSNSVPENVAAGAIIGNFSVASGSPAVFELASGELDNSLFTLNGNTLQTAMLFDYESRSTYSVRVRSTIGPETYLTDFLILVNPVNEFSPILTSSGTYSIPENSTFVGMLEASDEDVPRPQMTYSITGGADAARFTLIGNRLSFHSAPNFESAVDANSDNIYLVQVSVSDGTRQTARNLVVNVINVNDAPASVSISNSLINETLVAGSVVGLLSGSDEDAGDIAALTFEFASGIASDNVDFVIVGNELRTRREFDYETLADRQLSLYVLARDGFQAAGIPSQLALSVTNAPDRPTADSLTLDTSRNTSLDIVLSGQDGNGGANITFAIVAQPLHGRLDGTAPNLTYVPNPGYSGVDQFAFTTFNGSLTSFQALVDITVVGTRPSVSFANATSSASEAAIGGQLQVQLVSGPVDRDLYIPLVVNINSTATADVDFVVPGFVTIPAGQTSAWMNYVVNEDALDEVDEFLQLRIGEGPEFLLGSTTVHTLTILDNDIPPVLQLPLRSSVVTESNQTVSVRLALSAPATEVMTIPISISGSASTGVDFETIVSSVTFNVDDVSASLTIPVLDDASVETPETIVIDFGGASNYWPSGSQAADQRFTLTLRDDDVRTVNFATSLARIDENAKSYNLVATVSPPPTSTLRVPVAFSGDARYGGTQADFLSSSQVFEFLPNSTTATITLTIIDDDRIELTEPIEATLQKGTEYTIGRSVKFVGDLRDNDQTFVQFLYSTYDVWEDNGATTITAKLDKAVPVQVVVPIQVSSIGTGYATPRSDYTLGFTDFVFEPNQLTATRVITIVDDNKNESKETLQLSMLPFSSSFVRLGSQKSVPITILDNDPLVSIVRMVDVVSENDLSMLRYELRLSSPSNRDVVAGFQISGSATANKDYTALLGTTVLFPGLTDTVVKSLSLAVRDDGNVEDPETVSATITSVVGGLLNPAAQSSSITILDNDAVPTIDIDTQNTSVQERPVAGKNNRFTITVSVSKTANVNLAVDMKFSGDAVRDRDYKVHSLAKGDKVNIKAGSKTASFELEILNDSIYEGPKTIEVKAAGVNKPGALPKSGLVRSFTIVDDERPVVPPPTNNETALPPGSVILGDYGPTIGISPEDLNANSPDPVSFQGCFADYSGPEKIALCTDFGLSGSNGPLDGATAFFDLNFNGVLDFVDANANLRQDENELSEPSAKTAMDGSFFLSLVDYDFDNDGFLTTTDGRFVLQGGVDISTGLGWPIPLMAPVGIFSLTPVSTLVESLVRTQQFSVADAIVRTTEALGLTGYDLTSGASIYQVLANDAPASRAYSAHVQLYAAILGLSNYLAGVSGQDIADIGPQAFESVAALIRNGDATLELSQAAVIETIGRHLLDSQAIVLDDDSHLTRVSTIIALGIQKLASVELISDQNDAGQQFLLQINKIKKIIQGQLPLALLSTGAGETQLTDLETEYSSAGFDTKIAASVATVTVPPVAAINSAELRESNSGTSVMIFSVSLVGTHDYPVSLTYATQEGSAEADTDFLATTGTLEWLAGDNSVKTIAVSIAGDTLIESDESFRILLTQPNGLVIRIPDGQGVIINDDTIPVSINTADTENQLHLVTSAEVLNLFANGVPVQTGQYAQGTALFVTGQADKRDALTVDFSANSYRADQISFNGGSGTPADSFQALAGVFETLTYIIGGARGEGVLEFTPANADEKSISGLTDVESIDIDVSSVNTLVVRVPSHISHLIIEDIDDGRKRLRSNDNSFTPMDFIVPNVELRLVKASTATLVTISSTDAAFVAKVQQSFIDVTRPISTMAALPPHSNSLSMTLMVSGVDPIGPEGTATGISAFDIYVSNGAGFSWLATVPAASPNYEFTGTANTDYWFRTVARDLAGNVELKSLNDAFTRIVDVVPPTSAVQSAAIIAGSSGLFNVQLTGTKVSGSPLTHFDVYVAVDSGDYALVGTATAVAQGSGNFAGELTYQGIADGTEHTYRMVSRARDSRGNVEAAPATEDISVTTTIAAAGLTATAIDVQKGANQRSYIRSLDILFSSPTGLSELANTNRIKLERFDLAATNVGVGLGTPVVPAPTFSVAGNKVSLDFGATGLGGLRQAGNGFYRVLIDGDGNGSFTDAADKVFEFYRLFGDANGDGIVNVADTNLVTAQLGRAGANLDGDLDGNGTVNSLDRTHSNQQRGKSLLPSLFGLIDD